MLEISDKEFVQIADYIKRHFGIHLNKEKKALVSGRLSNLLQSLNMSSFSEYLDYIMKDRTGEAARTFINRMTTNHTYFMREEDHFHFFSKHVLPELRSMVKDRDLRIWSAGCSTGEEPYTLAMLIDEYLGNEKAMWDAKLLATDISDQVLRKAANGIYTSESIAQVPQKWRLSYFKYNGGQHYEVIERIKQEVIFRRFNLMDRFPFRRKFHVIFCRNVMIYFDEKTKNELLEKFYDALEPHGYLFIGHSETTNRQASRFRYVMPAVYRKE